jgi:PBP1b-binding outer membrane lipoprotein LpoB
MNYLSKYKSILLFCVILQACSTADKADTDNVDEEKAISNTFDQTKKKGIVLIDDNGKLGDLFKSGGDEIGSVNKYLWQASIEVLNFLPYKFG